MANKRKQLINKILNKKDKIKEYENIPKDENVLPESNETKVPEDFKKYMNQFSKEELIRELFITQLELRQTMRELELTAFRNVQNEMKSKN